MTNNHLIDIDAACRFIGGNKPIHRATLYRGIQQGRFPKPVKIGPNTSRWRRADLEAALERIIAAS